MNNYINNKWDGETLHRLFTTQGAEDLFIQNMLDYVKSNDFEGINIDFEGIHPNDTANFTDFMDKVYEAFHQQGLIVTMDVPPNDNSYDYTSLATNVDRMVVMLYDQHHSMSKPGPVAPTDWVIESLNQIHIPSEKLILSFGNYGYDWEDNSNQPANAMTFGDLMELGIGTNLQIYWNKQAGNPYVRYKRNDKNHTVWFLDAATFYNQMKLGKERGSSGIAVWRLGSEDPSIWNFINKPKDMDNPSNALKTIVSPKPVQYTGAGEILKMVSQSENGKRAIQLDGHDLIQNETYSKLPKRYGKSKHKEVVLSFDDGPDPAYTPQILDILNRNHIKGTFFIVGENAMLHPELVKRMHKEGQEIGNHTFTHPDIESITPFQMTLELNANQRLFQGITGHSTTLFRPPYMADAESNSSGELLPMLQAQKLGYTMVGELIDSEDWQGHSSEEIVNQVLDQLPEGNVILLHDSGGDRSNTVKALPFLIKELKNVAILLPPLLISLEKVIAKSCPKLNRTTLIWSMTRLCSRSYKAGAKD